MIAHYYSDPTSPTTTSSVYIVSIADNVTGGTVTRMTPVSIVYSYGDNYARHEDPPLSLDTPPRVPFFGEATRVDRRPVAPSSARRERRPQRAPHTATRHMRRRDPLVLR